ncbi:peptidase U32 family protein [Facklamia miroungae]|uniref:Putative protease n=1 Tax=Facklamia miroungae TaxID=120956 RepID=A0A1G7RLP7_9LACT|nr:U32 family peptidase [Facklamia miroungae]NKZ29384.1 U32 family peptidase [Facklamia miroungae]SDG11119.1 putative protease [Facklamia miroungae]
MTKTIYKKPELLAPAGTLEKLKTAIHYGADAVYIGGNDYGLRKRAGNFSFEDMAEGVAFAHERNAKVYVAANMITHQNDEKGAGDFFRQVRDLGIDAVIVSDPALMQICASEAPGLDIHLSTQQSAVNYETLNFWQEAGLTRCVLGREVSMQEIKEIRANTSIEIEAFIHGAMCISYSGRCTLSNHMANRDANRGGCCQSCRWHYGLFELPSLEQKIMVGAGEPGIKEPFSMSAVDMGMLDYIPEIIEAGIDSLKIEGRMKSIHYISTVVNVYRKAIDSFLEDPEHYQIKQEWSDELWKIAQRELSTGFYYDEPSEKEQLFGKRRRRPEYSFIGEVLDYDPDTAIATVQQRNNFKVGETIEFYGPGMRNHQEILDKMWDDTGEEIEVAPHAMQIVTMKVSQPVAKHDMLRKHLK